MPVSQTIFSIAELLGTIAFAVSGAMVGIEKRVDLFGVLFLGCITAVGGGITRDLLIRRVPPVSLTDPFNIIVSAVCALLVFLAARPMIDFYEKNMHTVYRVYNVVDALGLGMFTVTGCQTAIDLLFSGNGFLVVTCGVLTGVGGGLLRDVILGDVPGIFTKHIYAVASIAGGILYYLCYLLRVNSLISTTATVALIVVIRILAKKFKWSLPKAVK